MLLQHPDVAHHHAAVDRFDHVVDGQQAHLDGRKGLHLDAGAAQGLGLVFVCVLGRLFEGSWPSGLDKIWTEKLTFSSLILAGAM